MHENKPVENTLATIGAVLWMVQIVPQIVKSHRSKSTLGLSAGLMGTWAIACLPFSAYIVAQKLSIPLQIQPHVFGFLGSFSTAQCLHYGHGHSKKKVGIWFILWLILWAGFETGSIYALQAGERNGTEVPLLFYGYLSAVLLAVALLPQYWEIYKLKEVIGISLVFMAVDIGGGLFSFLSLFFREKLDYAAFISYLLVVILDAIVVLLAFILNPIAKRRRAREAAETGRVPDDPEANGDTGIASPMAHHMQSVEGNDKQSAQSQDRQNAETEGRRRSFELPEKRVHGDEAPREGKVSGV